MLPINLNSSTSVTSRTATLAHHLLISLRLGRWSSHFMPAEGVRHVADVFKSTPSQRPRLAVH